MKLLTPVCATILSLVLLPSCGSDSNSDNSGTGGVGGFGGSSGSLGSGGTATGSGGTATGSGGTATGSGGIVGNGGTTPGSGGIVGNGGTTGTAGASGAAGAAGAAGSAGNGGAAGNGGTAGNGGAAGHGGAATDGGLDGGEMPDASSTPDASMPDASPDAGPDAAPVDCTGTTTVDVTKDGSVAASSTSFSLNNRWAATRAVDGDVTTGWYGGTNQANVTFTWTGAGNDCITQIDTTNTAMVMNRQNWGYESLTVDVLAATGNTPLFTKTIAMTGSPDPSLVVDVPNGVVGRRVRLSFSGLENGRNTGGIAELNVKAKR